MNIKIMHKKVIIADFKNTFILITGINLPVRRDFMTVPNISRKNNSYKKMRKYLFIFANSENLTSGIEFLYRTRIHFKSDLYKTEKDYRIVISSYKFNPALLTFKEFCVRSTTNDIEIEFTKEHGKLLIEKNAIKTFGKYFF